MSDTNINEYKSIMTLNNYNSWLALRHVMDMYANILNSGIELSAPISKVHVLEGSNGYFLKDYQGYGLSFNDNQGNLLLTIDSSSVLFQGLKVQIFDIQGGSKKYHITEFVKEKGDYQKAVKLLVNDLTVEKDRLTNSFSIDHLLKNIKDLPHDERLVHKNLINLSLQRIMSFYGLYNYYGGVKLNPCLGEAFDPEDYDSPMYGFNVDFYSYYSGGLITNKNGKSPIILLSGESEIIGDHDTSAFSVDLFDISGEANNTNEISLEIDIDNEFDPAMFRYKTLAIAKASQKLFPNYQLLPHAGEMNILQLVVS